MSRRDPYTNLLEYYAAVDSDNSLSGGSEASSLAMFDWEDYWSDHVREMFALISEYNVHTGNSILEAMPYQDFFEFCFDHSSHRRPRVA